MKVTTAAELGEALKDKEEYIEIEGDLVNKTIRIRATGKVAWAIAIAAIGIAVYSILAVPVTRGASVTLNAFVAPAAVGVLGASVTTTAIGIAIAAGGIGALTTLRSYKEVSRTKSSLILKRR